MSNGYTSGAKCDLFREHYTDNSASYAASNTSDDYRTNADIEGTPTRTAHTRDMTAYATQPVSDSWVIALRQRSVQT